MKSIIIVCLSLAVVVLSECPDGQKYTDRYDNIDLNEILSNAHLLKGYVDCILDKGKCTPEGKELKSKYTFYTIKYIVKFKWQT